MQTPDSDIELIRVPGSYEMPLGYRSKSRKVAERTGSCRAGCGDPRRHTAFRLCRRRLCPTDLSAPLAKSTACPVGFGVLTVDSIEQAIERAGTKAGNKGEEAALAVIEMVSLLRQLD